MKEQLYAFLPPSRFKNSKFDWNELDNLKKQEVDGLLLLDPNVSDKHVMLGQKCERLSLKLILGFTDDPSKPDEERLKRALAITNCLAIGTTSLHEWVGTAKTVTQYRKMAEEYGFEWVCTITHNNILHDLRRGGSVRRELKDTLCMCLCGYVLAGYLFDEPRMPHLNATTLRGRNLHKEFGVTIEKLTEYLTPLDILSGAGYQPGLNVGSRVYARKLGFKGLVAGMPFDLKGTGSIPINPKPEKYPEKCGN